MPAAPMAQECGSFQSRVASAYVDVEVLQQPHAPGAGRVRRDGEEVDERVDAHGAHKVGEERDAALEDRYEYDAVVIRGGQLARQSPHPRAELVRGDEDVHSR